MKIKNTFIFLFALCCSLSAKAQKTVSYPELVDRLYDLEALTQLPQHEEKTMNFSSYDRASRFDESSKSYINWDANNDGNGFIRKEGEETVIFEADGPGVIWRVWSALAKEGHMKIYMDGNKTPVYDRPFRELFESFEDDYPSMNFPDLTMTLSRGRNSFIPIQFKEHCKITLSGDWGNYYHIIYSQLGENEQLQSSFTGNFDNESRIVLAKADRLLSKRGYLPYGENDKVEELEILVKPGEEKTLKKLSGSYAIDKVEVLLPDGEDKDDILKNVWFDFSWDSDYTAAVNAPMGMFFGSGPKLNPFRSLVNGVIDKRLYSNWVMPFSDKALLKVKNKGNSTYRFKVKLAYHPQQQEDFLRFHAQIKGDKVTIKNTVEGTTAIAKGRAIDWEMLNVKGTGRFCGVTLHIKNIWQEPEQPAQTWWYGKGGEKNIDWWWGEGDEKFFVDGEDFPSTYGTGSEDYIGYAWSAEPPFPTFSSAFANQPKTPIDGNGHTVVNRFNIADNVPFQESFMATIERYKKQKWGEQNKNTCEYEVVAYYYLKH